MFIVEDQSPLLRQPQVLSEQIHIELDTVLKDRDELKTDIDILTEGLQKLTDAQCIRYRQKLLRQASKLLEEKETEVLEVRRRKEDIAEITNGVMRAIWKRTVGM
ncbi:hypothetical protein BU25DRAFT_422694 [Macroventuria anomochaeta]|uniref:Uncharacterized protein n=1 Tax=Macroventuria anomochaeta TaxID=301207 RepID=A0ACB6RWE9_9PLEO|nr:uncharacterized protein BU25DRAFT_422694 [Macroventuria anomochaeta]KAF2626118.1 hypothetical protein BU25DRAFT_422694 [Macroventuria anomochaeta]